MKNISKPILIATLGLFYLILFPGFARSITFPPLEQDGCRLLLLAKNTGNVPIEIDLAASKERIKNGKWKSLYRKGFCNGRKILIEPRSKLEIEFCEVFFGCHFERQFQFTAYFEKGGIRKKVEFYFPSKDDYLEKDKATIDLDNIYRKLTNKAP